MEKKDCYLLGAITKAIGYKGELNLFLDTDEPETYENLESIFIEENGLLVPFFLKKAKLHRNQHLRILIEDYPNPDRLIGRSVFLPLIMLPQLEGNKFYYHEIKGFEAIDNDKKIGLIRDVKENTAQDLFVVTSLDNREILIPMIDDWIVRIDKSQKKIYLQLPEGLIDIFLID